MPPRENILPLIHFANLRAYTHVNVHFRCILAYSLFCIPNSNKNPCTCEVHFRSIQFHNPIKMHLTFLECNLGQKEPGCIWSALWKFKLNHMCSTAVKTTKQDSSQIIFIVLIVLSVHWNNNQPHSQYWWTSKNYWCKHPRSDVARWSHRGW